MEQAKLIVVFNGKFDLHWIRRYGIQPPTRCRVWDCQIAEFIIEGQKNPYPSLEKCLIKYDLGHKDDKIAEYWNLGVDTTDIPKEELEIYNNLDVDLTYKLYLKQQEVMTEEQKRLCLVMGLDLLVLAEMEWNGIKFNVELCKEKAVETEEELKKVTEELLGYTGCPDLNLDSGQQLSCFLYGGKFERTVVTGQYPWTFKSGMRKGETVLKNITEDRETTFERLFTPIRNTEAKKPVKLSDGTLQTWWTSAEDILKKLRMPAKKHKRIIELLLKRAELAKLMDTYYGKLPATLKEYGWGEYLHGQFNQVVAATGRLSSSKPNLQNFSDVVDQLLISRYE